MSEITTEMFAKLMSFAKANGVDLALAPEGAENATDLRETIPAVNLNRDTSAIAHETGLNLKRSGLFLYQNRLVTVSEDGKEEEMDDKRFRTWIDQWQVNYYKRRKTPDDEDRNGTGAPIRATMKADVAAVLLRSDAFRSHMPELKRILPVRLPVWDNDSEGYPLARILEYGYDEKTHVYTANTEIDYDLTWDIQQAVKYLRKLLKDFPFADEGRSLAVQIAGMVTTYCQLMFGELDRLPMIYFNANTPGSGKSRLAELMIYAIYGEADTVNFSESDEFKKELDTWAGQSLGYTFIDDVSGLIKSNLLNKWLTMPRWSGRVMHAQRKFSYLNQSLTLLTANQATLSEDLGRRSLMVDLWAAELVSDRQSRLPMTIDQEWLAAPENRKNILSALHSLLINWFSPDHEGRWYPKVIGSFEGWSRIVPAIVTAAGFNCPLEKPEVSDAGQKQEVEFTRLIAEAVRVHAPQEGRPAPILLTEWCAMARACGLFHAIIDDVATARAIMDAKPALYKNVIDGDGNEHYPTKAEKEEQARSYMDRSQSTKFSKILHKFYRGQIRTVEGRRYKFADREARHSTFTLELLPDKKP